MADFPRRGKTPRLGLGIVCLARDIAAMLSLFLRLAMLGGGVLVMWNVFATFARALRAPKKVLIAAPEDRASAAARDLCSSAARRVTNIEMAMAGLGDAELWSATEAFAKAVGQLIAAVQADPVRYRRARRHLGQILFGTEQATKRFAKLNSVVVNDASKAGFLTLLQDLSDAFERAASEYSKAGLTDLEIESQVLRDLIDRAKR